MSALSLTLVLSLATTHVAGQLPAPPVTPVPITYTAVSAGALATFPDASGDFEYTAIGAGQFLYGPNFPGGPTSWTPWTMNNGTGIAANNSGFTFANPPTSWGTRVAFVQGLGTMSVPHTFAAGTWRLRFQGAQRILQGVVNRQALRITVGGTIVFEQELDGSDYREYLTRPFTFATSSTVTVEVRGTKPYTGDHTALVDLFQFEPIGEWGAATTWSPQGVPSQYDHVIVPSGVEVAMRGNMTAATVDAHGELVAVPFDGRLETRYVLLDTSAARFEVGQAGVPFAQRFTLYLLGTNSTHVDVIGPGTKFLAAKLGGTVELHGTPSRSWTRLQSIAPSLSDPTHSEITVDDHSGWLPGDTIVVTYTGHVSHTAGTTGCLNNPYQGPRSRELVITAIRSTGELELSDQLITADHCTAPSQSWNHPVTGQGWQLDQRAEVGRLTRNVRIEGELSGGFGGHVMIMRTGPAAAPGIGHVADVEFANMGQEQILGHYPMHWHMVLGDGEGQYVRNCAIHHTHNRAITVHGTDSVLVENNVCFDVMGHAVFLEDGVEQHNLVVGNLVIAARKPGQCQQMLPHDNSLDQAQNRSPASFWISHPNNHFVGNVAADSVGVGYWFSLHEQPTGLSATGTYSAVFQNVVGTTADLGTFADNVAHSVKMGIDVNDSIADGSGAKFPMSSCSAYVLNYCTAPSGPTPTDSTDDDIRTNRMWTPPATVTLTGFTAFGCTTGIYTGGGVDFIDTVTFSECVLADNGVHLHLASANTVRDSVLVHDTGNVIFPTGTGGNQLPNGHLHGFEAGNAYVVYDGPGRFFDSYLVGYDGTGSNVGRLFFSDFGAARRHTNHLVRGLAFAGTGPINVGFRDFTAALASPAQGHSHVWGIAIVDEDGCLSGGLLPGKTVVTNRNMMRLFTASGLTGDTALGANAFASPHDWAHLQVRFYAPGLLELNNVPSVSFTRQQFSSFGRTWLPANYHADFLPSAQMRQLPVIVGRNGAPAATYEVSLENTPADNVFRVDVSLDDAATGKAIKLWIRYPNQPANWTPALHVNDNPALIHANGNNPAGLPALTPGIVAGQTSYQMLTIGTERIVELQMVNPATPVPNGRTHRISITW